MQRFPSGGGAIARASAYDSPPLGPADPPAAAAAVDASSRPLTKLVGAVGSGRPLGRDAMVLKKKSKIKMATILIIINVL